MVLAQPPYFSWARCNHGGSAHSTVAIADYDPVERGVVVALDLKKCDIKCLDDDAFNFTGADRVETVVIKCVFGLQHPFMVKLGGKSTRCELVRRHAEPGRGGFAGAPAHKAKQPTRVCAVLLFEEQRFRVPPAEASLADAIAACL